MHMENYRSATTKCKLTNPEHRPTSKWRSLKKTLWFITSAVIISYLPGNLYATVQACIFDQWFCVSVVRYSCNRGNNRRWREEMMYCCFAAIIWGVWLKSNSLSVLPDIPNNFAFMTRKNSAETMEQIVHIHRRETK